MTLRPLKQHGQQRARWRHLLFLYHLNSSSLLAQSHFLGLTVNLTSYSSWMELFQLKLVQEHGALVCFNGLSSQN